MVLGAGPAGCAITAALAARGASVLLVESNPKAARRLAGEWIHPEGVRVLRECNLLEGLKPTAPTRGFAVFPNDGLDPILLDYTSKRGLCCEHEILVTHLRRRAAELQHVQYAEGLRGRVIRGPSVQLADQGGNTHEVHAERIVVAAGRSWRGIDLEAATRTDQVSISLMAGLILNDRVLPFEGYGHVFLGGPGPILAYRIDEGRVRLCIDVPNSVQRGAATPEWIWRSFSDVLPPPLRSSLRDALARASLSWAANVFRPRCYRTESGVALIGDAAGVVHPLTAMGITMSLLDAEALAGATNLSRFATRRSNQSHVPELLSNAIYQAFVRSDPGSEMIRESILQTWRSSPAQCRRTMSLLGADTTSRAAFVGAFSTVALRATCQALLRDRAALAGLAEWLRWPWASLHPQPGAIRSRSLFWAAPETWETSTTTKEEQHAI